MTFKEWVIIREMTSTSCIAGFSRMTLPMVRRMWPMDWGSWKDDRKKKKKPLEQPQVKESSDPRDGAKCPECGSENTMGARTTKNDDNGKFISFANTHCRDCDNGFCLKIN
jgi:hypothetical protein